MSIPIEEANCLARAALRTVGYDEGEAAIIANHMIGCELRGVANGGLSRTLSVVERVRAEGGHKRRMRVVYETPLSAQIDGGGDVGYLVGHETVEQAVRRAKAGGIGVTGCSNTWYTGMFVHYMERIARDGLVAIAAGSSAWRVAPWGSTEGRFGTNPIAFTFPSNEDPIVADLGTSELMISEATLAARLGTALPEGVAFDDEGRPTTDPVEALKGCIAVWGGHKGSALAICVQLLGILAGSAVKPEEKNDCSMLVVAFKPELLRPHAEFISSVTQYAKAVRTSRSLRGDSIRMPFDRSRTVRSVAEAAQEIDVPDSILMQLRSLV